jgi:nicotinamidase-related amidase
MTTRALIVIDVQNEYMTGGLPVEFPPVDSSLANIARAMDAARAAGVAVVVIQHDMPADAPIFATGSAGWALHPVVAERAADVAFHKQLPGAFTGTDLEAWLRDHGIDTVSIAGYMTNICVDTTSRQAAHAGFQVEVLGDATGTLAYGNTAGRASAQQVHAATLATLHAAIGAVGTTDEWIAALGGDPLPPGDLIASTRAGAAA